LEEEILPNETRWSRYLGEQILAQSKMTKLLCVIAAIHTRISSTMCAYREICSHYVNYVPPFSFAIAQTDGLERSVIGARIFLAARRPRQEDRAIHVSICVDLMFRNLSRFII